MVFNPEKVMEMFDTLTQDIITARETMKSDDSQYAKRVYVRTAFALIEGMTHLTKVLTIEVAKLRNVELSPAELSLLKEESYELRRGKAKISTKYLKLADNFRFAFSCFSKVLGSNFKLDVEGQGWECFRKAIEIRHRITHPKVDEDLDISDAELQIVEKAMDWYRVSSRKLLTDFTKLDLKLGMI